MAEATTTISYADGIRDAWVGELQGEAFFARVAQAAAGEERGKWETLAELERVTGRRMAALLVSRNMSLDAPEDSSELLRAVEAYARMPFADAVSAMRPILTAAIGRFEALLAQAPAGERETVQFLVDHERAILSFVELEEAGEGAASLAAARALIERGDGDEAGQPGQPGQ